MRKSPLKRSQKPLKRTPLKKGSKGLSKSYKPKEKAEGEPDMRYWFLEIWDERQDENGYCYCFETGKPMSRNFYRELSTVYDHVLEKSNYEEYKFLKKNIVIILPKVHHQKGTDIDKTPKIKAYRQQLLKLHEKGELNNGRTDED